MTPSKVKTKRIGLVLFFGAPFLHLLHFFASEKVITEWYFRTMKDLLWFLTPHFELSITAIGLIILSMAGQRYLHWLLVSVVVHGMIDATLWVLAGSNVQLWAVHPITLGVLSIVQIVMYKIFREENQLNQ